MKRIADTGLLKAALDADDDAHEWAAVQLRQFAPFQTCDAVLVELAYLIGNPLPGLTLVLRGDLELHFDLSAEANRVYDLLSKYRDREMDLADACIVRMVEMTPQSKVWTVDRADFRVYRSNGRHVIPCEFPPIKL